MNPRTCSKLLFAWTLSIAPGLLALPAFAQGSDEADATDAPDDAEPRPVKAVRWHDTSLSWDHSATTQTVGLGSSYQSRNPTYEMMFRLTPRYYLLENEQRSLSLRADVRLIREFTNSDTTTREGEWTFADTEVWLATVQTLRRTPEQLTELLVRAPVLVLPTSKVSARGGRILGLGVGLGLDHQIPLRGEKASVLPGMMLRPRAAYTYQFVSSIVPVNDGIDRVRLFPDGISVPSDQLNGSAFSQHEMTAAMRIELGLASRLYLSTDLGLRYAYRYALPDTVICGVTDTGCTDVPRLDDASRWNFATLFSESLRFEPVDSLEFALGYLNLAPQLGADGQRRSFFYSPYARVFLAVTVNLDQFYYKARGEKPPEGMHSASRESSSHW